MLLNDRDFMAHRQRHQELLQEAEHHRLAHMVGRAQQENRKAFQGVVVFVGDRLVKVGAALQRYGEMKPCQPLQLASEQGRGFDRNACQ